MRCGQIDLTKTTDSAEKVVETIRERSDKLRAKTLLGEEKGNVII